VTKASQLDLIVVTAGDVDIFTDTSRNLRRLVHVHRSFTKGRLKCPKTEASRRAVPLQTIALERSTSGQRAGRAHWCSPLSVAATSTCTTSATASGSPPRTFDLARYVGASLTMIDRHYGHLACDGREHAIRLLDDLCAGQRPRWTLVDAAWTPKPPAGANQDNGTRR